MTYIVYLYIIIHHNMYDYIMYTGNTIMYIHAELLYIHIKVMVAKGDGFASAKQKALVQNRINGYLNGSFLLPGVNHYSE